MMYRLWMFKHAYDRVCWRWRQKMMNSDVVNCCVGLLDDGIDVWKLGTLKKSYKGKFYGV